MRRRHDAGEGDRVITVVGDPPRPQIELRHGSPIEECQPMQIAENLGGLIIVRIDDPNSVHGMAYWGVVYCDSEAVEAHLPSTTLTPSQTAPIRPVAMIVITALKV